MRDLLYYYKMRFSKAFFESKKIIEDNKKRSIFDLEALSREIIKTEKTYWGSNSDFGIQGVLQRKFEVKKHIIEHGFYMRRILKNEMDSPIKTIVTMSPHRKKIIEEVYQKKSIVVGPYIHYAPSLLDDQSYEQLKLELGKVLVIFPTHSTILGNMEYDIQEFIQKAKVLQSELKVDTVLVCLFYRDIQQGLAKYYEAENLRVVTAGHRFDPLFLSRLKSIIMLSDYTVSNQVGTHVGYSIYLEKPHTIIRQEVNFKGFEAIHTEKNKKNILNEDFLKIENELLSHFSEVSTVISEKQKEVCEKYFGFSFVK